MGDGSDVGRRRGPAVAVVQFIVYGLRKHGLAWLSEVIAINATLLAVAFVRYGGDIPTQYADRALTSVGLVTAAYTVFDLLFLNYRVVWHHASLLDMAVLALTALGTFVSVGLLELGPLSRDRPLPLSVLVLGGAMAYLVLAHLKLIDQARLVVRRDRRRKPLVIFGAGRGGTTLVRQLSAEKTGYRPVAFLDDDSRKVGRTIAGLPVIGGRDQLDKVVKRYSAEAVAIAIPSAEAATIREIANLTVDAEARALVLPSVNELMYGKELSLRDVGMEDLVGRSEVTVDNEMINAAFSGRRVLITGAAGSIGSELARQVASFDPAELVLLDNNESGLAELRDELASRDLRIQIVVGSVTDVDAMHATFKNARPQVVIHAAAYKHVDIVEEQPRAAIEVNVHGTWVCASAAENVGAERFIFVSTDKAVDPVGVLGTTKRIGELMMASLAKSSTVFAAVRFGNVLGSRGSVLPKFERQINEGGPLTVTHPEVRRFFMSIAEAVRLVLQSAAFAEGGHVYVLDMGEELSIAAFAGRLVRLRGLRVPQDIEMVFTGLRAGERMTEKLVGERETSRGTGHPKVMDVAIAGRQARPQWDQVVEDLNTLAHTGSADELRARLHELAAEVPTKRGEYGSDAAVGG
jgi:FlaA1/EpsC-like NDP-sugar epimerase